MRQKKKRLRSGLAEFGQRKRYLRSLEKDLEAELGPYWRNVIELAKDS